MSAPTPFSRSRDCLGESAFLYKWQPALLGEHVSESVKRCARFIRKDLGITHSQALEKLSEAVGFPNWHALHTAAKRIASDYADMADASVAVRHQAAEQALDVFAVALPLLVRLDADLPPNRAARDGLAALAESLSDVLELPIDRSRDLIARTLASDTWEALFSRDPVDSREPLYAFDPERGAFVWSEACQALVDKQDSCFQDDPDFTGELSGLDRGACFDWISQTCQRRPDFLEGLLALGTELEAMRADAAAGKCYREAIRQADALISDYRGKILWGSLSNRFYHRLLYAFMRWSAYRGYLKQAIRLALRQLRLNPNDNLGIRYELPVLLAADGQYDAGYRALKKWIEGDQSHNPCEHLTRSMCLMAPAPSVGGLEAFLRALFLFPFLRNMIINQEYPEPFSGDRTWSRGMIPDASAIFFQFDMLFASHPMVERAYRAVLDDPEVARIEAELAALYRNADLKPRNPQVIQLEDAVKRTGRLDVWFRRLGAAAVDLAGRNAADWIRRLTS